MIPKLTILIVSWNSWADLKRCLNSIQKAPLQGLEILVVDNGSVDGTAENVKQQFPHVRLHENAENLGLPKAVNQGFSLAKGEYIMLLDVDTEVAADAPGLLLDFMEQHKEVSLAAARIYTPQGHLEQSARNLPSVMNGLFGRQSFLSRVFPNNPYTRRYLMPENSDKKEPFQVEQVSAACMFMRHSLIDEVGPWDEGYRCYWIDSDFCAHLKKRGKIVYCVPQARVVHYENNKAGKKKSPWRIWHFHMGANRLYRKYYTLGALDPRSLLATAALTIRAGIMLIMNAFVNENGNKQSARHKNAV